ncbi:hypothetical protein B0A53_04513 [Rhodotorula sp. CCFEE 5036]|nr:hypothetical protein B0A53_04513 [Rhodotorula sp. CCFEE 5036]
MSAVPAEPPHLVQLEIRRTFPSAGGSPTPTPSPSPPHDAPRSHAQAGDRAVDHAADGSLTGAGHAPEQREQVPPPPPNIYLGETYTANVHLSVPADAAPHAAHKVHLVVEMHSGIPPLATRTAGTPTPPAAPQVRQYPISTHDFERIDPSLPPSRAQEIVVPLEWELKELASHAVVCLVSYGVQVADRETGELELVMRSYRKILRFDVLNPLSVRTKAHAPSSSSPSAFSPNTFYSPLARRKLFLEVQVQNHCDSRMTFRRMRFEPVQGFHVSDEANQGFVVVEPTTTKEGESAAAQQQQRVGLDFLPLATGSVRQFLYILTRTSTTRLSGGSTAAAAQHQQPQQEPLGRLDIVWQTERGQHGRLQSATLGRKLPPPPPAPPPPPSGPTLGPDLRLGATSKHATSSPVLSRTGSNGGGGTAPPGFGPTTLDGVEERTDARGLKFDVTVEAILPSPSPPLWSDSTTTTITTAASRATFLVNEPVSVLSSTFTTEPPPGVATGTNVDATAAEPIPPPPRGRRRRRVRVAVQHVQWHASPIRDQPPLVRYSNNEDDDDNDGTKAGDDAGRSPLGVGLGRSRESVSSHFAIPGAMPPSKVGTQQLSLPGVTSLQQQQSLFAAATRNNNNNGGAGVSSSAESASTPIIGGTHFVAGHQATTAGDDDRNYPMMHGVRLPLPIPIPIPNRPPPPGPVPSAGVIRLGPDTVDVGYLDVPLDGLDDDEGGSAGGNRVVEMRFVPLERGLVRFGGVRILVLPSSSSSVPAEVEPAAPPVEGSSNVVVAETVWEAGSIAEIWCQ